MGSEPELTRGNEGTRDGEEGRENTWDATVTFSQPFGEDVKERMSEVFERRTVLSWPQDRDKYVRRDVSMEEGASCEKCVPSPLR